ncbi:MAG: thiamine pyrophosphate-requiring protein [Burkholderiales bacterium]|nr:thiamine pyrophosphate-requiring protein [Burkholderiales bacterium]
MNGAAVVAEILKREGVTTLYAYPRNGIIEAAAAADIRPIVVRQERTGMHMADALSRITSRQKIGVFAMQQGPGTENAYGALAQAYAESVPILVLPAGHPRRQAQLPPNFSATLNMRGVTKWIESVVAVDQIPQALRRAFTQLRNGRPRPVLIEVPADVLGEAFSGSLDYQPVLATRMGPDPAVVPRVAEALLAAKRPVLYAGQGVHYARAWKQLRELAELLAAPVTTTLAGKSAFPENHPLSLGSGGATFSKQSHRFIQEADLVFGIGVSFTATPFGHAMPAGKRYIHATWDPVELNKCVATELGLLGDLDVVLDALLPEVRDRLSGKPRDAGPVAKEIKAVKDEWLAQWMPLLTSNETPISPYRLIRELHAALDPAQTIITHDSGSPRNQIPPFWESTEPLSYIGWGKSTQLGYGLGLIMGAKLARPDKLCVNFWGDAAIGHTGMDFETCVRERIPILSILSNNFAMAAELGVMPSATEKFRSTDISGNYADFARALGAHGERITDPGEVAAAIRRGIQKTREGVPVLLEFITRKETRGSSHGRSH